MLVRPYTSSHPIPVKLYEWQIRELAGQSMIPIFFKAFLVCTAVRGLALSSWIKPFGTLILKGIITGFSILAIYWRALSVPSASTKSVLHHIQSPPRHYSKSWRGVRLDNRCFLWPFIRSSTVTLASIWMPQTKERLIAEHHWIPWMSQLTLALHHANLCCLWYGISDKHRTSTRDLNPTSSNLFPTVRGDTLPVTSGISAVVIRLFTIARWRILRSCHGVVLLEGLLPHCCPESIS